jgi:hypothetical protein
MEMQIILRELASYQPIFEKIGWLARWVDSSQIASGLIVVALSAYVAYRFCFKPNLKLEAISSISDSHWEIDLGIQNKKQFQTVDANDLFVQIFIPEKLFNAAILVEENGRGESAWQKVKLNPEILLIKNIKYCCSKHIYKHNLFPRRVGMFLRIKGLRDTKSYSCRIYYKFSARYGTIPRNSSMKNTLLGKDPYIVVKIKGKHKKSPI